MNLLVSCKAPRKPLVPCVGCGHLIAKYSDVEKGHVPYDAERGFVCLLCKKTVCSSCLYHTDLIYRHMYNSHKNFRQQYGLYQSSIGSKARYSVSAYACRRCVAEFEMDLINKIGYEALPLYINHPWMTGAARKYYQGVLEGRYECPITPAMT
jgi:hypothetical protein